MSSGEKSIFLPKPKTPSEKLAAHGVKAPPMKPVAPKSVPAKRRNNNNNNEMTPDDSDSNTDTENNDEEIEMVFTEVTNKLFLSLINSYHH